MASTQNPRAISSISVLTSILLVPICIFSGFAIARFPILLGLIPCLILGLYCLYYHFQVTVIGLLVLRSSLDAFSRYQLPALFAIGVILLTISYCLLLLITKREVNTNWFFWFLLSWVFSQFIWVVLIPLGGVGQGADLLAEAVEQWLRMFSWAMMYLLVTQLRDLVHPKTLINGLFLSLIIPLTGAFLQIFLPPSALPSFLVFSATAIEAGSRINGTMGHPNSLSSFAVLFIGLSLWKLGDVKNKVPLFLLLGTLVFVLTSTKSLGGLVMVAVFALLFTATRLNFLNLLGAIVLLALVLFLFSSSDFGRERLASLYETPILNRDMDLSRTLMLAMKDGNSLNWRIAQWTFLIDSWRDFPIMGYGLATTSSVSVFENYAHNDYVGALVEGGIVGFTTFLIFLGGQFTYLFSIINRPYPHQATVSQKALCFILISLLVSICIAMLAANMITQTTFYFYWFTLLSVAGWDWTERETLTHVYVNA